MSCVKNLLTPVGLSGLVINKGRSYKGEVRLRILRRDRVACFLTGHMQYKEHRVNFLVCFARFLVFIFIIHFPEDGEQEKVFEGKDGIRVGLK